MENVTQEEFIQRCFEKYGNNYDFSKAVYTNSKGKVEYTCLQCGTTYTKTANALMCTDCRCKFCECGGRAHNTSQFIIKAKSIHGDKYDYSKVDYKNAHSKVCIICPIHGEFLMSPNCHLRGHGCSECSLEKKKLPKLDFYDMVLKCREIFGDLYDYDKAKEQYINNDSVITITCKKHGDFVTKFKYLVRGHGCPTCNNKNRSENLTMSEDEWKRKATLVHKGKYSYDKSTYTKSRNKITITCPIHGDFEINAAAHLGGAGCQKCANEKNGDRCRLSQETFIKRMIEVYGEGTYNYDKVVYKGMTVPVDVVCPTHGVFTRKPCDLLKGGGCTICGLHIGERKISVFLSKNNIDFIPQYKIPIDSIFCKQKCAFLDFYIPSKKIAIEYNGEQHYKETYFHTIGRKTFEEQQERDWYVRQYCKEKKIKLLEIPYWESKIIDEILKRELKI